MAILRSTRIATLRLFMYGTNVLLPLSVLKERHSEASSLSAISSNLVTLFKFLPVPGVFSVFSSTDQDIFGRAMPLGK